MNIKEKIIDYINRNKVSSTEISDCLGKTGVIEEVNAVNRGHFRCGNVFWTYGYDESMYNIHEQIRFVSENDIVIISGFNVKNRSLIGELIARFLITCKKVTAIVVVGNIRDANEIINNNYAVWCKGFNPVGCFKNKNEINLDSSLLDINKTKYFSSIAICDDTGVVIIPKEQHTEKFYEKLLKIEEQEKLWFNKLDNGHMNTFDIVCLSNDI